MSLADWQSIAVDREKYQRYLCSREWAELKRSVMQRSFGICERCRIRQTQCVHHLTYERKYKERLDDLQGLCNQCHEFIHGKTDFDPIPTDAIVFPRGVIKSVYLAGSITGTTWRDEIAPGWSYLNESKLYYHCDDDADIEHILGGEWAEIKNAIPVNNKVSLSLTGPFWFDRFGGGHGTVENNTGKHAMANCTKLHDEYDNEEVLYCIRKAISETDLVFCWLDKESVFGTMLEIGIAFGMGKEIVVYTKKSMEFDEHWLALQAGHWHYGQDHSETAGEAWRHFVSKLGYGEPANET